jgi:hypothetical protein
MFAELIAQFKQKMVMLTDKGFVSHRGNPDNMMVCGQKRWNVRMVVEVVLSMLTTVCHCKKMRHPVADYFEARLGLIPCPSSMFLHNGMACARTNMVLSGFLSINSAFNI